MRLAEARIDLNQSLRLDPLAAIQIVGMLSLGDICRASSKRQGAEVVTAVSAHHC
jgi:hypothetical protein